MAVELVCPFCRFSKRIPEKKIPARAKWAICPRCKQKFDISPLDRGTGPVGGDIPGDDTIRETGRGSESETESERSGAPWENRFGKGLVWGVYHTFKAAIFSPAAFFRGLTFNGGIREPLAFGLLIGAVGNMFGIFWPVMMVSGGLLPFGGAVFGQLTAGLIFLILMVAVPIGVVVSMFIYSAILHLLLLMVRGGKNGFEASFRVVAYSQAAQVWELIPVIGSWVGGVWQLVVQVIGLREIHGISYLRVIVAFLLPVAFLFALVLAVLVPLLIHLAQ
ncbi:MAG: YIP1 family protein [Deltaproteobacteria bacterium]|nr:YIP1 family protein [Deltaproteobacteria bacterium]